MLARAFRDDPTTAWLFPDPGRRARRLERMIAWELATSRLTGGELVAADGAQAAALWMAPQGVGAAPPGGAPRPGGAAQLRLGLGAIRVFGRRLAVVVPAFARMMHELPPQPFRYLSILGTEPSRQRSGLGSSLLQEGLDRSDREGVPTLLHTATAADVAFYGRRGFVVVGEARLPGGPVLWAMRRGPGGEGPQAQPPTVDISTRAGSGAVPAVRSSE